MLVEKEFEIIYSYNLISDNITLQELINKRKELLETKKIEFQNKIYAIVNVFLKEDSVEDYKLIIQVDDYENRN